MRPLVRNAPVSRVSVGFVDDCYDVSMVEKGIDEVHTIPVVQFRDTGLDF